VDGEAFFTWKTPETHLNEEEEFEEEIWLTLLAVLIKELKIRLLLELLLLLG